MIQATIGGTEKIVLSETVMTDIEFSMMTPQDSNARSTDQYIQLVLKGRIIPSVGGAVREATVAIDNWASVVDGDLDAYRPVTVRVIEAGIVVREYNLPNAFVVDYEVDYSDVEGNGKFMLKVRQRKDKSKDASIEGGYAV